MNSNRKNARWAGVFYVTATVAPILTYFFIGFLGGGVGEETIPDYLADVSAKETHVIIAVFIEFVWALAVVGIVVTLFPILRQHNETLALGFYSLRFIEAISSIVHLTILLLLLTLSQEYAGAEDANAFYYQSSGDIFLAAREWTFLIGSGLVWSLSALILNYLLYQSKLVPRWLSGWGIVGAALSFAYYVPRFFSVNSVEVLYFPIALQEMVFAAWLIVKGFNSSAIATGSAKTALNQ